MALDPRDAYIAPRHAEAPAPPRPKRKIGDKMPDGTIYAGVSPHNGQPLYVTSADAPLRYSFNQARKYAAALKANSHQDWRMPTQEELYVLFSNRAAIGGFKLKERYPAGWYWSACKSDNKNIFATQFSFEGSAAVAGTGSHLSLRCIRGAAPPPPSHSHPAFG